MPEKKNTILVVDDEPQIQKMLGILLGGEDFKIIESLTGKEAVRVCASVKPDLVLLDIGLPDMDGKDSRKSRGCICSQTGKYRNRPHYLCLFFSWWKTHPVWLHSPR